MTSTNPECSATREDLAEFALGLLSGRERARLLAHVASCAQCRGELESLSVVTDALVALSPPAEPPLGFESRLADRYRAQPPRVRRRTVRHVALAAAALVLVAVGFEIGNNGASRVTTSLPAYGATPISATLTSRGQVRGHLWMSAGAPTWIYMSLDDANWSGTARCRVTLKDGRVLDIGVFTVVHGHGAWAARVDASSSAVTRAQVTDVTGRVLASAVLST